MLNFASIETIIDWLPISDEAFFIKLGFLTAAVLIATLSAPLFKTFLISSKFLIPPPTVNGTNIFLVHL